MADAAWAMVQHGVRDLRRQQVPLPEIGDDDALLRIEACGVCGSDVEQYDGTLPVPYPAIPGHEPVGIIERIGAGAAARWGVAAGDRVAVEAVLACGACDACLAGETQRCRNGGPGGVYGYRPLSLAPGLWGGYAEYLYLPATAIVHAMSQEIAPEIAVMFNPLGAGIRWAVTMPGLSAGESIVVLGPGQRGLAAVIAAKAAGAGRIIVTGLGRDERKLALAREFGADETIVADGEDVVRRARELTGGGADVVVDVTSYAVEAVTQAVDIARKGGRVVLAGTKGMKAVPGFVSDKVVVKELSVLGAFGVDYESYERAVRLVESGAFPLEKMHTHTLPIAEADRALRLLAGESDEGNAIHIALMP